MRRWALIFPFAARWPRELKRLSTASVWVCTIGIGCERWIEHLFQRELSKVKPTRQQKEQPRRRLGQVVTDGTRVGPVDLLPQLAEFSEASEQKAKGEHHDHRQEVDGARGHLHHKRWLRTPDPVFRWVLNQPQGCNQGVRRPGARE